MLHGQQDFPSLVRPIETRLEAGRAARLCRLPCRRSECTAGRAAVLGRAQGQESLKGNMRLGGGRRGEGAAQTGYGPRIGTAAPRHSLGFAGRRRS